MTSTSNQPEFVFRFNLNDLETSESADSDPLIDMLKHFLTDIQRIGYLCCNGEFRPATSLNPNTGGGGRSWICKTPKEHCSVFIDCHKGEYLCLIFLTSPLPWP
jgi:hypothetical protein